MKIKPGLVKNELTADQINRIGQIWNKIKDVDDSNLETFELDFMRDTHPDNEITIWENVANGMEIFMNRIKAKMNKKTKLIIRKKLFIDMVSITCGGHSNEEILNDKTLSVTYWSYLQAKNNKKT
jgi:hypothetical protein